MLEGAVVVRTPEGEHELARGELVRFAPGPLPAATPEAGPATPLVPAAVDVEQARAVAASITDEELRESVQRAVSFHLARERSDRPV